MNSSSNSFQAKTFPALVALLLGGAAFAQGCGGDDNVIPTPRVSGGSGGASGSGGKGGKSSSGGSSGQSEAGNGAGNEGGTGNDGSGGTGNNGSGGEGADGSGGTGNNGSGGTGNNGSGGEGAEGNQGNQGGEGNQGGDGNGPDVDCSIRGTNGCYRCAPEALDTAPAFPHSANEQFLNHCDDSKGARFPNAERIPGFTGTDSLPELP